MKQSVMDGTNEYFDTFTYDYAGRKTSQKAAIAYTYASNPAYTTMWVYDYAGRVLEEYNKDGYFISNTYDSIGRLLTTTDYKGNEAATPYYASYTYDILGRKLTETIPFTYYTDNNNNQVIAYAVNKYYYDRNGKVTKTLVKNNAPGAATDTYSKTATDYNSRGLAEYVKRYEGDQLTNEAAYTYNARGSILTSTVGSSVTTYAYDDHGRLHTLTDARNEVETYTYNKNNLMTTSVDRNNLTTTYTYDGLGRNLTSTVTKDGYTIVQTTTYTATGQVATQAKTNGGTITSSYTYNALGQNISVNDNYMKTYTYDIAGNRTSFTYDDHTVTYVYDEMGRLSTVSENSTLQVTYTYDINGNQQTITNNVTGIVTTNTYNLANMVSGIANMFGTLTRSKFTYAYRLDGNQIVKTDDVENTVTSYVYNDMGQLTAEAVLSGGITTTTSYTYDNRGNRSIKTVGTAVTTYTYDANNRLTSEALNTTPVTITEYEYDDNGNQLTKTVGGVTTTSTYDGFNFLINDGEASYSYGATGQRRQKYFAMSDTYNSINQTWDGNVIIQDNYLVIRRYVWGLNLIYMVEPDGSKTYYLYNAHGDVVQLTNEDGVVIKTYHYDAFGVEISPDTSDVNPFRYCGEYFDKETSTYYLRARHYNPVTGRFTQQDGWEFAGTSLGLNLYTYCSGNPISLIDPSGHYSEAEWLVYDIAYLSTQGDYSRYESLLDIMNQGIIIESSTGKDSSLKSNGMNAMSILSDMVKDQDLIENVNWGNIFGAGKKNIEALVKNVQTWVDAEKYEKYFDHAKQYSKFMDSGVIIGDLDEDSYTKNVFQKSYRSKKDGSWHESNCVWYAYGRYGEQHGEHPTVTTDPIGWTSQAKLGGMSTGTEIKAQSVGVSAKHVVYVEYVKYDINGNVSKVYYTDCNAGGTNYGLKSTTNIGYFTSTYKNYIY